MGRGSGSRRLGAGGGKVEITPESSVKSVLNILNNTNVRLTANDVNAIRDVLHNKMNVGDSLVAKMGDVSHTFEKLNSNTFARTDDPFFTGIAMNSKQMAQQLIDFTGLGWKVSYKAK